MTVPAAGSFSVIAFNEIGVRLTCPECGTWVDPSRDIVWPEIRDLITAASEHATTHAMSEAGIRP